MSKKFTVSALQIGASPGGSKDTLEMILSRRQCIEAAGACLVVMPEGLLGGYPKSMDFGARVGYRTEVGREVFFRYWSQAIEVPGPETRALSALARTTKTTLVVGVIERTGTTLFCTSLLIWPDEEQITKHRKLMPTGSERLIWER